VFGDQHGVGYTVQCESDCYTQNVTAISPDGTLYYDVTLTLFES
jgi:hypothetical protein